MAELDKLNVKIDADASGLKKEVNNSIDALEKLKAKSAEIGKQLSIALSGGGATKKSNADLIENLANQRNAITKYIKDIESGAIDFDDSGIDKFISSLDGVDDSVQTVAETISDAFSGNSISYEGLEAIEDEIEIIKQSINDSVLSGSPLSQDELISNLGALESMRDTLAEMGTVSVGSPIAADLNDLENSLYKQLNLTTKLSLALDGVKSKCKEIKDAWNSSFSNNSGLNNIKKIGLALIGVRSTFMAIRKAMGAYLSQNEDLQNKLNGIWYALGSMLAPILEWIVGLFAKLVVYVNAFLKGLGLAGIDMTNLNKGATKLKKLISGFDELNIYSSDKSEQDQAANPMDYANANPETVEKLYELGEKLRPIFETIRDIVKSVFDFCVEHLDLILGLFAAIEGLKLISKIVEIGKAIKNVFTVITGFKIFDKLKQLGTAISGALGSTALTGVLTTIAGVLALIDGLVLAVWQFIEMWQNGWSLIGEILKDIGIALAAVGAVILGAPAAVAAVVAGIVAAVSSLAIVIHDNWDAIVAWTQEAWTNVKNFIKETWTAIKDWTVETWNNIGSWLSEKWENIKNTIATKWTEMKTRVSELTTQLGEFLSNAWSTIRITASNVWTNIKDNISTLNENVKDKLSVVWDQVSTYLTNKWSNIKNGALTVWEGLKQVYQHLIVH